MEEIWKDIAGYEGLYKVSNLGNVKSLNYNHTKKPKILKTKILNTGYVSVQLHGPPGCKTVNVHRLVAEAFIGNPDNLPLVNHKDGTKTNNCASNLEWCTVKENVHHAISKGLRPIIPPNFTTRGRTGRQNSCSVPVAQYSLDGKLVKVWDSMGEAERCSNYSQANISNCCRGKRKTHAGFIWRYAGK